MKVKIKILAGFMLIILMLLVAGAMTIYEFSRIGNSVESLIDDNYKTIEASKKMIEALEREDSGILLLLSGKWEEGRTILRMADSLFLSAFNQAENNLTEENEGLYIARIENTYTVYKKKWELPIVGTAKENSVEWYLTDVHKSFLDVKVEVEGLINLNQESMYKEASSLKEQAHRAIMPGIVAIASSLIFLIIFNFFIGIILVRPIKKLIHAVKAYNIYSKEFSAEIINNDDLKILEDEIHNLIQRIQK